MSLALNIVQDNGPLRAAMFATMKFWKVHVAECYLSSSSDDNEVILCLYPCSNRCDSVPKIQFCGKGGVRFSLEVTNSPISSRKFDNAMQWAGFYVSDRKWDGEVSVNPTC